MPMIVQLPQETEPFCVAARKKMSLRDDSGLGKLQIAS